jgi:hypothetical protein
VTQRLNGSVDWRVNELWLIADDLGYKGAEDLVKQANDAFVWITQGFGNPWTRSEPKDEMDVWAVIKGWPETPGEEPVTPPYHDAGRADFTGFATVTRLTSRLIPPVPVQPSNPKPTAAPVAPAMGTVTDLATFAAGHRIGRRTRRARREETA